VEPGEVLPLVRVLGEVRLFKEGRGIVGAAAAVAWRPRDRTYEILAYRRPGRWGTPREIDPEDVALLDERFPSTFNNYDHRRGRIALAPHTPCPVLLGIRGDDPSVLPEALASLRKEEPEAWLIFETNQGTDDHIQAKPFGRAAPLESIRTSARVAAAPRVLPGGHVVVLLDDGAPFPALAYEPSKEFRRVARALAPGDRVVAWGSVRAEPRGLNLEKLQVLSLAPRRRKLSNPRCPGCGRAMKSVGRGQGFRCPACRLRAPRSAALYLEELPAISPGIYEPPVCSRRHISKPIKRMAWASPPPALPAPPPPPRWRPPAHPGLRPAARR
jgi:tRNA(Ile2)-agmatinylcytidine synthase